LPSEYIAPLGYVACLLTVIAFVPQVYRAWRTKQTGALSLGMLALLVTAAALWTVYGISRGDWPVILTNSVNLLLISSILVAKIRFK
jgi:MtN3 and saliva related transmembrane protein